MPVLTNQSAGYMQAMHQEIKALEQSTEVLQTIRWIWENSWADHYVGNR